MIPELRRQHPRIVFDPFAGTGTGLGKVCDALGFTFDGIDIERWNNADSRVREGDATLPADYPTQQFMIATSPTYSNGLNDHFCAKDPSRRFTYRVALGKDLHENNTGRYSIRGGRKAWATYWRLHADAVRIWADRDAPVIVNVKAFVHRGEIVDLPEMWEVLLIANGYTVTSRQAVPAPGIRFGANSDARVDHEMVLTATLR